VSEPPQASTSPRAALAEVAERVVARMPGVALAGDRRGAGQTSEHGRVIGGVTSVAAGEGRYELRLQVVVAWPPDPLPKLADELRRRVRAGAKRAGLASLLGPVEIEIVSIEDPDSPTEADA
jgi:hypothetical protein